MVQFNFSERTIKAKVVYYGPAQSGKTTNLEQIHRLTDPQGQNRLISLNTAQDRTLFFDLLPFSLGAISGYDFKVQLYTVPGQVQYNATRRVVLAGADAVVFVADSRRSMAKENTAAFENMKVNLLANRLVPEKVPLVLQYNKQDLPDLLPPEELARTLNFWKRPAFPSVAARGDGVMETFIAVVKEMLQSIAVKYNLKEKGLDPATIPEVVDQAFSRLVQKAVEETPATPLPLSASKVVVSHQPEAGPGASLQSAPDAGLVSEELLHRAIKSNVELAEALAGLVQGVNQGLSNILSHAELLMVYREDAREKRLQAVTEIQNEAQRLRRIMQELGQAGGGASAGTPAPPAPVARPVPAPLPPLREVAAPQRPAAQPATPLPEPALAGPTADHAIRDAIIQVRGVLQQRSLSVNNRVPPVPLSPRVPAQNLRSAVAGLLEQLAQVAPEGSAIEIRAERKPVLLTGRDGAQVKKDFLMLAAAHDGEFSAELQQAALRGAGAGPLGGACKTIKDVGGFVRFAPLAAGRQETRFFVPAT